MPANAAVPNLGAFETVGIGVQTAVGTPAAATIFLRKTGGSGLGLQPDFVRSAAAYGTLDPQAQALVGNKSEGSLDFELTLAATQAILEHIAGAPAVVGPPKVITPVQADFAALMPAWPLTFEVMTPGENRQISDAVVTQFAITWNARGFLTGSLNYRALTVSDTFTPATVVIPASAWTALNATLTRNAIAHVVESLSMTWTSPMDFVDGTNGTTGYAGFARPDPTTNPRELRIATTIRGADSYSKTAFEASNGIPMVVSLVKGSEILRVDATKLYYATRTPPGGGNGPIMTQLEAYAAYDSGATPPRAWKIVMT